MNPLMVASGVGKGVDATLRDVHPVAEADFLPCARPQLLEVEIDHAASPWNP